MPKKRLTDLTVKKLKPPAAGKQIDYFDTGQPGLSLRINYGGAKVWRVRHYKKRPGKDGKLVSIPTTYTLGKDLTVVEARTRARAFLADPQAALEAEKQAEIAKQPATGASFSAVAEEFIKRYVERKRLRTQAEIERLLDKLVLPVWGDKPFRDIRRSDVTALLDSIEDGHGARQADYVLAIFRKMTNWYAEREDDYVSPVPRSLEPRAANKARTRVLNDAEIKKLWEACADQGTFGALLKMLLLTAARRAKIMTMTWDDVVKDGTWTIASEPREKPHAGSLTLPQMALDIIAAQPRLGDSPYIFAGSGGGILATFSKSKADLDAKLAIPPWRIHDLRRTAKTLMQAAGVLPHISERVLGHTIEGVEGVYDQHTYTLEKADALNRLAARIAAIVNPPSGNVVAFPVAVAPAS